MKKYYKYDGGFTWIEFLAILATIMVVAAMALPFFLRAKEKSRIALSTYIVTVDRDLAGAMTNKADSEIIDETIWGMRLTLRLVDHNEMLALTDPEKGDQAYRMATLRELLALANTKPGRPKDRDIVALGSYKLSVAGKVSPRLYPVINGDELRFSAAGRWPSNSLFVIVAPK